MSELPIPSVSPRSAPRLLYLVSEDWYFLSHRLPMAQAAQRAGYEVHVATQVGAQAAAIEALGFQLHRLDWYRGSMNPLYALRTIRQIRKLYRRVAPDLAHHVALQASVFGSLAVIGMPIVRLNALAGLGFMFISQARSTRLMRGMLVRLLSRLLNRPGAAALVQNPDDAAALVALGVGRERIFRIPGSGVDTTLLAPLPEPAGAITVAFVGRLLDDKGVRALIDAQAELVRRGRAVRVLLAGETDPANPASIPRQEVEEWARRPGVTALGHVGDIRRVWEAAHIAVLPSRREGLPKSLLEAAACGRPIVATDVPGCREIARPGVNALLVPVDAPTALADAIDRLAGDAELRRQFAAAGRRLVEEEFSADRIGRATVALYDRLLGRGAGVMPKQAASA
jgi:glycosyltransferase involved in cell wall biosynthesis